MPWPNKIKKIDEIAYHRNGISGTGFYAVRFRVSAKSIGSSGADRNFIASVFPEAGSVSVICLDHLPEHGVAFGLNSWRGDEYEVELRSAIREYESKRSFQPT